LSGPLSHVRVQARPGFSKKKEKTQHTRVRFQVWPACQTRSLRPFHTSFPKAVRRRETANARGGGIRRRNHIAALSVESCGILQAERWGLWGGSGDGARVPGLPGSLTLAVNFVWCCQGVTSLGYGIILCLRFAPPDLTRWCKKALFKPTRITWPFDQYTIEKSWLSWDCAYSQHDK
jgi:hypothetical protein